MAERRMFTEKVVESDAFLDLPFSAQCLYFHLNMNADDDGFLNSPGKIIRIAGASQEDLKLLIEKRFILYFGNNIIAIKHWRMHNSIRKDRYKPTQYQKQFSMLSIKDDGSYTERQPNGNQAATNGDHRLGEDRLGEGRLGEGRLGEESGTDTDIPATPSLSAITEFVKISDLSVNPNRFFAYYNERDWKTPKGNPIDWAAKILEWDYEEKQKAKQAEAAKSSGNPFLALAKAENLFEGDPT